LSKSERSIWDLIVRRFMAVFGKPAITQRIKVSIKISGYVTMLRENRYWSKGGNGFMSHMLSQRRFSCLQ